MSFEQHDTEAAQFARRNSVESPCPSPLSDASSSAASRMTFPADESEIALLEVTTHRSGRSAYSPQSLRNQLDDRKPKSQLLSWLSGMPPHKKLYIKPAFPQSESRIPAAVSTWLPQRSLSVACAIVVLLWAAAFYALLTSAYRGRPLSPDEVPPVRLACNTRLWQNSTFCGLNGLNCAPFLDNSFTFLCPSQCASVRVLEPHTVGNQEIIYRNMVIGGSSGDSEQQSVYRGDSFICQAAIHAGLVSNSRGGCGVLTRMGEQNNFVGTSSNGIASFDFVPTFPLAHTISAAVDQFSDPQWRLLVLSVAASVLISLLATSSRLFIFSEFIIVFFQVALASDRPFDPTDASAISMALERFLPTAFVVYAIYRSSVRHTLHRLQPSWEKTLLWLGGCWIGAMNNYTFDRMPISRLTVHDLRQQPGAILAILIVVATITAAAIGQISAFRSEGRLLDYLSLYAAAFAALGVLALVPDLQLRLHHYILALILLPGTSVQTRRSLLFQGLLFGLFLNGLARWGYASVLQTTEALREDGQLGSALPELLYHNLVDRSTVQFAIGSVSRGFDGISMLVNDVERYQISQATFPVSFNWTRLPASGPTFFRFAFTSVMPLGGLSYRDFSRPSTWHENGTWTTLD